MSTERPLAPPQYSPDGRWWWDGRQWLAVPPATAARPNRQRNRIILVLLVAGIILVLVAVVASSAVRPTRPGLGGGHTIAGTVTLFDTNGFDDFGEGCQGRRGFDDMHVGAQVTVTNESGTVLGTSSLGAGHRDGYHCTFPFQVTGLPNATFYGVEIAHRGRVTYSAEDLSGDDWKVEMSLGS